MYQCRHIGGRSWFVNAFLRVNRQSKSKKKDDYKGTGFPLGFYFSLTVEAGCWLKYRPTCSKPGGVSMFGALNSRRFLQVLGRMTT